MSLLIAADTVELYPKTTDEDEHGWRLPGTTSIWSGLGNLQLGPGISNPLADAGGGRGPYGPAHDNVGQLFLPMDVPLADGMTATVRGRSYVLSQVREVADPAGVDGALGCWQATVTSVDSWPGAA